MGWSTFNRSFLLHILIALVCTASFAQQTNDTFLIAKTLQHEGEFVEARNILQQYLQFHPQDYHGIRAVAYANYWANNFKEAEQFFRSGLTMYPEDKTIMQDLARFLYETANYAEAKILYSKILLLSPNDAEGLLNSAYIAYFEGQFKTAESYLLKMRSYYPNNQECNNFLNVLQSIYGLWLKAEGRYMEDSQPLNFTHINLTATKYMHSFFQPGLEAGTFHVIDPENSLSWIELSNKIHLRRTGTRISLAGGAVRNKKTEDLTTIGSIILEQSIAKDWYMGIEYERDLEFSTTQSFLKSVTYNAYTLKLSYEKGESWMGEAALDTKMYTDENQIQTLYFWFLSPSLNFTSVALRAGYNFNYSSSRNTNFKSKMSLAEISENYYPGIQIHGFYDPYFTPKNQYIHSLLMDGQWNLTPKINLQSNFSLGFFSKSRIPYLYLDLQDNEVVIATDFYDHSVVNYDINTSLNIFLNSKTSLHFVYRHLKNFFYTANQFQMLLSTNLYHAYK